MARTPVLAAGGIVLRRQATPLIAVVRLRKRNEWVLPKGKLDDGETPRAAAEREVLEETGHEVSVHEFLGTLVYDSGGRYKVVHYWRMEAGDEQAYELMYDIKAVDWLPLEDALERLSRDHERAFLENVGPIALQAAALSGATGARRPSRKRGGPAVRSRRRLRSANQRPRPLSPRSSMRPSRRRSRSLPPRWRSPRCQLLRQRARSRRHLRLISSLSSSTRRRCARRMRRAGT